MRLRNARVMASERLATPNLDRMLLTWDLTLEGLTVSLPSYLCIVQPLDH